MDRNLSLKANYFMVNYRDIPDTDFLCEYGGDMRLKVSKIPKSDFLSLPVDYLCAIVDSCVLVFENIGKRAGTREDMFNAIVWYKKKNGFKSMFLLNR
ncbi:MAG TPA: hypothetical protein VGB63_01225 [Pedobacter sp.]|jgi:hypothetical protein